MTHFTTTFAVLGASIPLWLIVAVWVAGFAALYAVGAAVGRRRK